MQESILSRRTFLRNSALTTATALAAPSVLAAGGAATGSNERLRIGYIGVGGPDQGRCQTHLESGIRLQNETGRVEVAAVCDVFNRYCDAAVEKVRAATKRAPASTGDYREIINDPAIDAVCISTPDHWHARQTIDALRAGKHVYCEKPMTHSVAEALEVLRVWKDSGLVMQVGVQSTQLPVWQEVRRRICDGQIGKLLQYQTEFFRNSDMGQWRYYPLAADMTPKNIDWKMFLGSEFGLAPDMPFDRAKYGQWRCYWPFGAGMFTDLFVHRTTSMLLATGLRFPARVVGAGGIFLEYDGRDVPDVATVVADFEEGAQGLVTATMCCQETPLQQTIRGHHGSFVFGVGEDFTGFDFKAERPQVTRNSKIKSERVELGPLPDTSFVHFQNFCDAAIAGEPEAVKCSPELGAAAMLIVKLGAQSYREGKVFHFNRKTMTVADGNPSWAAQWEQVSKQGGPAHQVDGWRAGNIGSVLYPRPYQQLAGPWIDGVDPAAAAASG